VTSENFSFGRQKLSFSELTPSRRNARSPAEGLKTLDMQADQKLGSRLGPDEPEKP
jgi:hypothetical protein